MKRAIITGLSILTAALTFSGCGGRTQTAETAEEDKTLVKTTRAVVQDIDRYAEFTSNIQAYKENFIAPSLAVRINQILVDVGANVRKGQLLVTMDPTQHNQASVQLANLEADYQRLLTVYEAGGISKQDMDQAETQLIVQREQVQNLLDNIRLTSPIDGVVTARNYDPGDLYNGTPILQIMQINTLKVSVNVSEQYFPYVKMGMPAEIRVDMYPDKVFEGKVSLIYPAVDASTRTFQVEITIPNPSGDLRPGMFSRTQLHFGTQEGILIEDVAVQRQLGSNDKYVYVIENGRAVRHDVTTGIQVGDKLQILRGLSGNEEVVTAGFSRLVNGSEVEIVND